MTKKAPRKDVMSLRIEPRLKYLIDLGARIQRRNLTNYVEWALEESLKGVPVTIEGKESNLLEMSDLVWNTSEPARFIALATNFKDLLTFEEQKMWELIKYHPFLFTSPPNKKFIISNIDTTKVIELWDLLNESKDGNKDSLAKLRSLHKSAMKIDANNGLLSIADIASRTAESLRELLNKVSPEERNKCEAIINSINSFQEFSEKSLNAISQNPIDDDDYEKYELIIMNENKEI